MSCAVCGASLRPGAKFCASCGSQVVEFDLVPLSMASQGLQAAPVAVHLPDQATPEPATDVAEASATGEQAQPGFASPVTPAVSAMPYPQRAGLSRGKMIGLTLLALLAMLGGISLILYSAVVQPAQLHMQATATALAELHLEASQTARADAQASATAQAIANATSTAQALATAQAVATATALQDIYTRATRGTPVFDDPLSYDANNWDIGVANGGGGCSFSGGAYHAAVQQTGYYLPCFAQGSNFSNFAYQVSMTFVQGDEGGIIFRSDTANSKAYLFDVKSDGTYSFYLTKDSSHNAPLSAGFSSAFHTGLNHANLLTVVARGSDLYLYINRRFAASVSDGTYSSGEIGVFAGDSSKPTDAAFTNAKVWQL
jgi:hypothetical protein